MSKKSNFEEKVCRFLKALWTEGYKAGGGIVPNEIDPIAYVERQKREMRIEIDRLKAANANLVLEMESKSRERCEDEEKLLTQARQTQDYIDHLRGDMGKICRENTQLKYENASLKNRLSRFTQAAESFIPNVTPPKGVVPFNPGEEDDDSDPEDGSTAPIRIKNL